MTRSWDVSWKPLRLQVRLRWSLACLCTRPASPPYQWNRPSMMMLLFRALALAQAPALGCESCHRDRLRPSGCDISHQLLEDTRQTAPSSCRTLGITQHADSSSSPELIPAPRGPRQQVTDIGSLNVDRPRVSTIGATQITQQATAEAMVDSAGNLDALPTQPSAQDASDGDSSESSDGSMSSQRADESRLEYLRRLRRLPPGSE